MRRRTKKPPTITQTRKRFETRMQNIAFREKLKAQEVRGTYKNELTRLHGLLQQNISPVCATRSELQSNERIKYFSNINDEGTSIEPPQRPGIPTDF